MKTNQQSCVGQFVLRDNSTVATCRNGLQKGIMLNDKYYLDTASLIKCPLSLQDAKQSSKQVKIPLPTKRQLQMLADNLEIVIEKLRFLGYGDYLFLGNLLQECWSRRSLKQNFTGERRRVFFIAPI